MLTNVVLKDFVLDSNYFDIFVQGSKVVDIAESTKVLKIEKVSIVADGIEKKLEAYKFFTVDEIEISERIFKNFVKAKIRVRVISLANVSLDNVLSMRPGEEINVQGKAELCFPECNIVESVVVVLELTPAFFETIAFEFAGTEAEAKLANKVFKTAQKKYVPPEITDEIAKDIGEKIGINWEDSAWDVAQFKAGMLVELEHGLVDAQTNITNDDLEMTGKIALAHLKELPDYYDRLAKMEKAS